MEKPTLSLIVPIYNGETYLETCLNSILGQTFRDFEALLVNDGSTDGTSEICHRYARSDSRLQVIDKPNGGVSQTRNYAMDRARGTYLQFMDADDWLAPNAMEVLCHAATSTGCDLVISHFYRVAGERLSPQGHIKKARVLTRQEFAEHMMKAPANFYYGVLWNKLYRRSIVESHRLRCPENVDWCEDFLFNCNYIQYIRLVAAVPQPLYYYRKRPGSLVDTHVNLRTVAETKRSTFAYYKDLYRKLDLYEDQKAGIYRYLLSAATDGAVGPLAQRLDGGMKPDFLRRPFQKNNSRR